MIWLHFCNNSSRFVWHLLSLFVNELEPSCWHSTVFFIEQEKMFSIIPQKGHLCSAGENSPRGIFFLWHLKEFEGTLAKFLSFFKFLFEIFDGALEKVGLMDISRIAWFPLDEPICGFCRIRYIHTSVRRAFGTTVLPDGTIQKGQETCYLRPATSLEKKTSNPSFAIKFCDLAQRFKKGEQIIWFQWFHRHRSDFSTHTFAGGSTHTQVISHPLKFSAGFGIFESILDHTTMVFIYFLH